MTEASAVTRAITLDRSGDLNAAVRVARTSALMIVMAKTGSREGRIQDGYWQLENF
jgi:hypothetical protein